MISELFEDKNTKAKDKVTGLAGYIIAKKVSIGDVLKFAEKKKEPIVASCVEALEIVSREAPQLITREVIAFVSKCLSAKAPRLKWESAKVLGNSAADHVGDYKDAIPSLIELTEFEGTVVRWSAAYAIAAIIQHKSKWQAELVKLAEHLAEHEEKGSIAKIYKKAVSDLRKNK